MPSFTKSGLDALSRIFEDGGKQLFSKMNTRVSGVLPSGSSVIPNVLDRDLSRLAEWLAGELKQEDSLFSDVNAFIRMNSREPDAYYFNLVLQPILRVCATAPEFYIRFDKDCRARAVLVYDYPISHKAWDEFSRGLPAVCPPNATIHEVVSPNKRTGTLEIASKQHFAASSCALNDNIMGQLLILLPAYHAIYGYALAQPT